jgi:hypothetical protein
MKAKITPKKKTASLASLKAKADRAFSVHVRTRDIDRHGHAECVTCGLRDHWKNLQAGHFISRVVLSTRFNPVNVQVQCFACNVWRRGNPAEFAGYLQRTYGHGVIESLLAEKRKTVKYTKADYLSMIERFTEAA